MADVIEVIHQINYQVNDAALANATEAIKAQIAELNSLNNALKGYQQQLSNTRNITALDDLSRKIDTVSKQIEASVGKANGIMQQFGSGIIKGLGLDSVEGAVSAFTSKIKGHFVSIASSAGGIMPTLKSVGNGITALFSTGTTATSALSALSAVFGGIPGIATAAITVLGSLAVAFATNADGADDATEAVDGFAASQKKIAEGIASEVVQLNALYNTARNTTLSYYDRSKAVDELQSKFPKYFDSLDDEIIMNGDAKVAYDLTTQSIAKRIKETQRLSKVESLLTKQLEAQAELDRIKTGDLFVADDERKAKLESIVSSTKQQIEKINKDAAFELETEQFFYGFIDEDTRKAYNEAKKNERKRPVRRSAFKQNKTSSKPYSPPPLNYKIGIPEYDEDALYKPAPSAIKQDMVTSFPKVEEKADTTYKPSKLEKLLFGDTANEQNAQKRRREEIKKSIDAYQTLATTAAQAFQDIYAAQVKALDAEIEIRKKRVDAAMKLAERGNTEALRIEEEKLKQAEKKREEYARKQQIINSALAVSNAVVAVANAASQSGAGALVIVPAVIAAIIAGYAAISAATKESSAQAFADGVVAFRGKGGPRDDANWVRISSGESVITAAGTQANKHILEAINNGAQFRMVDPRIQATMPMLKAPDVNGGNNNYASQQSMKNLEDKLDGVIDAIEGNRFKQDIFFNEQGVGMLTERAVKRSNRRFK